MDEDRAIELGAEVSASREKAELTLRELGERVGLSEGRIRQIEKGYEQRGDFKIPVKTKPRTLRALVHVLGEFAGPLLREAAGPLEEPALGRGRADTDVLPLDGLDEATKSYLRTIAEEARRRNPDAR